MKGECGMNMLQYADLKNQASCLLEDFDSLWSRL
jgi:hypothetical protein